ncbi:MAG: hypothetical protein CGU29_07820 [Candidatus Dactylopiibacterium carminicum]|uniref:Uncharacterized protein n=1 Tax=Candidatus Dactylopiibacterium carminicum TaxID=857335 RepID=A0A272ETN7_9RHOO|nr:hypothetical protein [Candidatus Dactylopiibacterium carminicum]KAF7599394.1 hypothetical protein BGI27_08000 [Candidatus Dactylopiibacterium carminicum]PAS93448.1 MAG: hypothetical protein CGU29_07820 [Candidatus Dactylopiibacterium carminicum]PAS99403.1 MAG: hypothetical protein BSR46_08025 [Candidatus Dactylopiibacterium carminicum]
MSGAWSCSHDVEGICQHVRGARCAPGMRGCVLEGKVRFANPELNLPRKPVKADPGPKASPEKQKPASKRRLPF